MRAVIQRVSEASVKIDNVVKCTIDSGLLIFLGVEEEDMLEDIQWLTQKIIQMRIFSDLDSKMNLSVQDINGEVLVVSQFTLFASTKKGNRPSFIKSAKPDIAVPLYEKFLNNLEETIGRERVKSGTFGADMKISLLNDGPVTIIIDSKNRE
ncbi:MAG: D-aminoacyl-tRNA deacylase [Saprospiraceae bacterium]